MSGQGKPNSVLVKLSKFVIKFRYAFSLYFDINYSKYIWNTIS